MAKMNADLKSKWIEALRSGKFEQGTGTLKQTVDGKDLHCCLGVLWEIAGRTFDRKEGDLYIPEQKPEERGAYQIMENLINPEFDFTRDQPITSCYKFWGMNDTEGMTFSQIADYVQEHC